MRKPYSYTPDLVAGIAHSYKTSCLLTIFLFSSPVKKIFFSPFRTGLAFSVQNWAQQFTPPAHTALILALEPVSAAITSWLVLGERLGGRLFIGAALIFAGMVISELWGGQQPRPVEG